MRTSCIIQLGQNAISTRDDISSIVTNDGDANKQPYANLTDLETGQTSSRPYATFEPDFWLLDGNYKIAPSSNAHGGWVSLQMSGSGAGAYVGDGEEISIDFSEVHSTDGITIHFSEHSGDYIDNIRIRFYDASLVTIAGTESYTPSSTVFSAGRAVSNFKRILISCYSSSRPFRYARISRIDFDEVAEFTGEQVKAAKVIQQIDPLSTELTIDTLDLTLFSDDGDFSIVNPAGVYANLQYKEPLDVYEDAGDIIYVGRFYLDKWESISENEATFQASDAISLLDSADYIGHYFHPGALWEASDVIDEIMTEAGIEYELDSSLETAVVTGFIPTTSYREALQQVAFRIGAYVTCARSSIVRILPLVLAEDVVTEDYALTSADKGISSPLTLKPLVTGVEVMSHRYTVRDEEDYEGLMLDAFAAGDHRVFFGYNVPLWDTFDITGATNTTSGDWRGTYIDINVASPGDVEIIGSRYRDTRKLHSEYNGALPAGTPANIVRIDDGTLVSPDDGDEVTERIYDYHQQRYLQKTRLYAHAMKPGDSILVDVQGAQMMGIVERMDIDLAGGFVSDVEIVGILV